jgi:hypothetical protein
MSILDDAIREHLELIRRRGATDSEVARLEDEAFGPPTRPDEADFPESEEAAAATANGVSAEPALDEPSPEEAAAHEDVTTLMSAPDTGEEHAERIADEEDAERVADEEPAERIADEEPGTGLEEPTGAHIAGESESEDMLIEPEEEPVAEAEHEEPIAEEHAIVEEPALEEHEEDSEEEAAAPEEATSLYDQSREELDIDLDLTVADEEAPAEAPSDEHPAAEPEGATPLEPPIESLDTVEHPFHEEIVEEEPHDEALPSDEYAVEEAAPEHPEGEHVEEGEEEGDEDVLADTPEFLKDAPEDDELWFEQGEPKDFDF